MAGLSTFIIEYHLDVVTQMRGTGCTHSLVTSTAMLSNSRREQVTCISWWKLVARMLQYTTIYNKYLPINLQTAPLMAQQQQQAPNFKLV